MSGVKWSNDSAFPDGNNCQIGDVVVGLRSGANYKFDFPSDGIKDGNGNYLVGWATTGAASTDYMQFTNGEAGTPSSITMASSGPNASLDIILKGTGVLDVVGLFDINGSNSVNSILDEDNMASDSATALATQQSIKAYVDNKTSGTSTSIVGTQFQVLANGNFGTPETGTVTLTTPQDIATTSSPTFAGLTVDNLNFNGNTISSTDLNGDINLNPSAGGTVVVGTDLDAGNINIDGNTIISTDVNGDINITADNSGEVVLDGVGWKSLTDGQLFIGSAGSTPTAATLTAGAGIAITNSAGSITISGTGGGTPTSIVGTQFQVLANGNFGTLETGTVTLTTPQDIATTSSPTFAGLDVDNININGNTLSSTNTNGNVNIIPNGTGDIALTDAATGVGNVGIGTSSPAASLHIKRNQARIRIQDADGAVNAATPTMEFYDSSSRLGYIGFGSSGNSSFYIQNDSANSLLFRTNNATRMAVDGSGNLTINSSTAVNSILDEDNMASDSATALATQQSIKAYVDAKIGGGKVVQYAVGSSSTDDSTTSTTFQASSLSVSITPTSGTNRIVVLAYVSHSASQTSGNPENRYTSLKIRNTTQSTDLVLGDDGRVLAQGRSSSADSFGATMIMGSEIAPDTSANTYQLEYHANGTTTQSTILGATNGPLYMIALELAV